MSPTPSAGFFGGIQSGFQTRSNYARSQQAAQEKLRTHMRQVEKDRTDLQGQIGDDARGLMTEFQSADEDSMQVIQDKMQYMVDTTEDKSMLPTEFFDGSYGLRVPKEVAEAMVPGVDASGVDRQGTSAGGPSLSRPSADEQTRGLQGPGVSGAPLDKSKDTSARAYDKLKGNRAHAVAVIQAGGLTPQHVIEGFGSKRAYQRAQFKDGAHHTMLGILTNEGTLNPGDVLRDPDAWANAKNIFYMQAEQAGMDSKDAKAVVDRFEKDRELAESGITTDAERSAALTDDLHKFLGKWFQIEGGMNAILAQLQGEERKAYLGAIKEGLSSIVAHPEQQSAELMLSMFNILDVTSQMQKDSGLPEGIAFQFEAAQTRRAAGSKPMIPTGTPPHGEKAMKNIPGSMYATDGKSEYLSVIHPGTGEVFYVEGAEAIQRVADANAEINRKKAEYAIAEEQKKLDQQRNAKAIEKAAAKKAAKEQAAPGKAERQKKVSSLRDTPVIGGIRSGLGAVAGAGADVVIGADDLVDGAGNLIESGYGGVKKGVGAVRNVAESIFGGL